MKERLVDLIEKSGMVEKRSRCEIIADELLAAGVCFAPVEIVIRKDITDEMLRQVQNAFSIPGTIMPYIPGQESVEIIQQWHPASDPPKRLKPVICLYEDKDGTQVGGGYLNDHGIWTLIGTARGTITHWMHMPKLPEEAQK